MENMIVSGLKMAKTGFKEYRRLCADADLYQYRCPSTGGEWKTCSFEFARDSRGLIEVRALKVAEDDLYLSPPDVVQIDAVDQVAMDCQELKIFNFAGRRIRKQARDDSGHGYFSTKDAAILLKVEKRYAKAILDGMCSRGLLRVSELSNGTFYRSIDRLGFEIGHIKMTKDRAAGGQDE